MYELVADNVALEFFAINPLTGDVTLIKDLRTDTFNGLTYRVCMQLISLSLEKEILSLTHCIFE